MSEAPSPSNNYAIPAGFLLDVAPLNALFGSIGQRLAAYEATVGQIEAALDDLPGQSLAIIQANVGPQLAAAQAALVALQRDVALAQDALADLLNGNLDASSVLLAPISGLSAANVQAALAELQGDLTSALARTAAPGEGTNGRFLRSNGDGSVAFADVTSVLYREYEARAELRALNGPAGSMCVVRGLGLFSWLAGSTEPDDDETCFATAGGRWLVQAWSPDAVYAFWLAEIDRLAASGETLFGQGICNATSINPQSSFEFAATVLGAAVGDAAIVAPPAFIETTSTAHISIYAVVTAGDTVRIRLNNLHSGNTWNVPAALQGSSNPWRVAIIKNLGA